MDSSVFLTVFQKAIMLIMIMAAPMLLAAIIVGLALSIIQSVTQIQEQTLTFVPKIFAALIVLAFSAPWMLDVFTNSVREMFDYIRVMISS